MVRYTRVKMTDFHKNSRPLKPECHEYFLSPNTSITHSQSKMSYLQLLISFHYTDQSVLFTIDSKLHNSASFCALFVLYFMFIVPVVGLTVKSYMCNCQSAVIGPVNLPLFLLSCKTFSRPLPCGVVIHACCHKL